MRYTYAMRAVLKKAFKPFKKLSKLHPALKLGGGLLPVLVAVLIVSLVAHTVLPPEFALASGIYTNATTDADGNTHLAANNVTTTSTYDLATDSDSATQQQIGTDPNWDNGITRQSGAVKFDGTDDYVQGATGNISGTGDFTAEAWIRPSATVNTSAYRTIVAQWNSGTANDWTLQLNSSGYLELSLASSTTITDNLNLADGLWHHVAGVRKGTKFYLFVDGALRQSSTGSLTSINSSNNVRVGKHDSNPFAGQVDEVRLSNSARYAVAFSPARRVIEDATTLLLWHFDEGTGTSAVDSSGNANTGTLTNGPTWATGAQALMQGFHGCSPDDANDASCSGGGRQGAGNLTLSNTSSTSNDSAYEVQMVAGSGATVLDGTNDFILVPNSTSLNRSVSSTVTMEAWVYPTASPSGWTSIMAKRDGANYAYGINYNVADQFQVYTTSGIKNFSYTLPLNTWTHVAGVIDSSQTRLYINGKLTGSAAGSGVGYSGTQDFTIGSSGSNSGSGTELFTGRIDEVRISGSAKYSSDFFPARRLRTESDTAGLWHLDEGTGTTAYDASGNSNVGTLTNGPTWGTGIIRTDPAQGDPLYYKWRVVGGSWSTPAPVPSTTTELPSTGVEIRFNPNGLYGADDKFKIASWAIEALSTSTPQRGSRRSFPRRAHLITSASGIDIIDASTNKLWMRAPVSDGNEWFRAIPYTATMKNGILYVGKSGYGFSRLDFSQDQGLYIHHDQCYYMGASSTQGLAVRATAVNYSTGCDWETSINGYTYGIGVQVIGGVQYFAGAGLDGIYLYNELTHQQNRYVKTSGDDYLSVALTSGGRLYAANSTAGGVDVWTNVTADTADQTGADLSYTTSSTPALLQNTVNSLSVTEGNSTADGVSNVLAVGTNSGADVIDEHSTQASGTVRHYTRQGSVGTSGYSEKNFGGALSFDGTNDFVTQPSPGGAINISTGTIEAWFRTTDSSAGYHAVALKSLAYGFYVHTGTLAIYDWNTSSLRDSGVSVADGVWHHAAVTFDSGVTNGTKLWLDGVLVLTTTITATHAAGVTVGCNAGSGECFSGLVDEVRVSNITRYTTNFTPSTKPFGTDSNTVTSYHFDERDGQNLRGADHNIYQAVLGASSSVASDDPTRVWPALGGTSDKVTSVGLTSSTDKGSALSFDGSDDFVTTSLPATYGPYTLATWVYLASDTTKGAFMKLGNSATGVGLGTGSATFDSNGNELIFLSESIAWKGTGVHIGLGWHHVAATVSVGGALNAYIDGSLIYTSSVSLNTAAGTYVIGGYDVGTPRYTTGTLDDVRVYTSELTAADISSIYNNGFGRTENTIPGLASWYKFNEGTGQTLVDSVRPSATTTRGATSGSASDDPTWVIGSQIGEGHTLWAATNGAGSDDGAVTGILLPSGTQSKVYTTSNSDLSDADVTSLNIGPGGLALIGTEAGAWSVGGAGTPEVASGAKSQPSRLKGNVRLKGGTRLGR